MLKSSLIIWPHSNKKTMTQKIYNAVPSSIRIEEEPQQCFRHVLKHKAALVSEGSYYFQMENKFIPLGAVLTDNSESFGKIDGRELSTRNLSRILEVFTGWDLLLHCLDKIDLSEFVVSSGVYVHDDSVAVDVSKMYTLYYLEIL